MGINLDTIKQTLINISQGNDILSTLIEFERTLDDAQVFAYKNWILGELCDGPTISRYWYKVVFMYPAAMMPDPNAGLRLTKLGAKVNFRKGVFKKPVRVEGPQDWVDPESKRAKMAEHEVWLVTIELPMKYINRGLEQADDVIHRDLEKANSQLENAYTETAMEEEIPPEDGTAPTSEMMPPEEEV
jgi:hypothetical protein